MTCPQCGRYGDPCPETGYDGDDLCPDCKAGDPPVRRRLTRQERLEGLADSGCDTHEEYREER